jgi:hypothetical protein
VDPQGGARVLTSQEKQGLWRRMRTALIRAILGKSSHDYMKQFTGSDEYCKRAIAAQLGWPRVGVDLDRRHGQTLKGQASRRGLSTGPNSELPIYSSLRGTEATRPV